MVPWKHLQGSALQVRARAGTQHPHPLPHTTTVTAREPTSRKKSGTSRWRNKGKLCDSPPKGSKERRGEAAGYSGKPSPHPAEHSTSRLAIAQGSRSQPLCPAEGSGPVSGEMPLCCARALAAEEAPPALDHTALRAAALLGGRWEQGSCSEEGVCIGGDGRELSKVSFP